MDLVLDLGQLDQLVLQLRLDAGVLLLHALDLLGLGLRELLLQALEPGHAGLALLGLGGGGVLDDLVGGLGLLGGRHDGWSFRRICV